MKYGIKKVNSSRKAQWQKGITHSGTITSKLYKQQFKNKNKNYFERISVIKKKRTNFHNYNQIKMNHKYYASKIKK